MKKGKTYSEIKKALPKLESQKVKDYSDALDKIVDLKKLFKSDGGKELIKGLQNNCAVALNKLVVVANSNPTLDMLLSLIHKYSANMSILTRVQDISDEEEIRNQLDEIVKEAME